MYVSPLLPNKCNQLNYSRKNYTSFKQVPEVKAEQAHKQAENNDKKKKNIHTAWILALTAFAIADGIWEHKSYMESKAANEALQKSKEITDKTIKELEESTLKIEESIKNKELEIERLKSKLGTNSKEKPVNETSDTKKKHSK